MGADPGFRVAASAAVALFAVTLAWRFLTFTGFSNDHYAHLALAQQLLLGERPIRDFSDPGWPLTYLISAAAWRLAGDRMVVEWTLTALALAAGSAFTALAAYRLSASVWIAIFLTLLEIVIFPRTYAYPKVIVYALGAWLMIAMAAAPSWRRILPMAAFIAVAFLLRHDHGLFLGAASAACLAVASRAGGWRTAMVRAGGLAAATGVMLLPWVLFVTVNGGIVDYFDRAFEYAAAEANASNLRSWPRLTLQPGRPLFGVARPNRPLLQVVWTPDLSAAQRSALEQRYSLEYVRETADARWYDVRDRSDDNLGALAKDAHVAETSGLGRIRRPLWREALASISPLRLAPALHVPANADAWLFWLFWALPVLCAAQASRRAFRGDEAWPGELAVVGGLCVMAVLVNAGFLRDALRTRLPDAVVPASLLGAWALGRCWRTIRRRGALRYLVLVVTVIALLATVAAVRQIGEWPERIERTGVGDGLDGVRARARQVTGLLNLPHRQNVSPPSRISAALLPFFQYLDRCSSTSDQIIVTGEYPDVVVLAGRGFASDGAVFGAWYSSASHQAQTVSQMDARPALFVVYMDQPAFRRRFPLVEAFVSERYRPMAELNLEESGPVPILVDRRRKAIEIDAATGWPCFSR